MLQLVEVYYQKFFDTELQSSFREVFPNVKKLN